jgi:peptidoglycan/xylan/chitin deacetylase (PgdA/CDA1 family)
VVLLSGMQQAAIQVDLDGAAEIYPVHGWKWPRTDDPLFESGLSATLDLLDSLGLKATLFAIARSLDDPRKRPLLQEAVRRGHAIGSHGFTHRRLTRLTREEQHHEVVESRLRLQEGLGTPVAGFRSPGFFTNTTVLAQIEAAGYRYDSSLFAGQSGEGVGSPGKVPATPCPLSPGTALLEVPLPRYRPLPWPWHPSYALALGEWYFRLGLRLAGAEGPVIVLLHLTDLADPLPEDALTGWRSRIFTLSHLSAARKRRHCEAMLTAVGKTHEWTTTDRLVTAASERMPA